MIFNDIDFCDYLEVNEIRRNLLPEITTITHKGVRKVGERFIRQELGMRRIEVDVTFEGLGKEFREKTRLLAGLLYTEEEKKLIFKDEPDKYYKTILSGATDLEEIAYIGEGTLLFLCPDPLAYAVTPKTLTNVGNTNCLNSGTYAATGILTVTLDSTASYLQVKLEETGEYLRIEDSLKSGDEIVIDLENEKVTKNGFSAMTNLALESDFFALPKGTFKVTSSSGVLDIEFTERWL